MFAGARRLLAAVTFGMISVQAVEAQVATGRVTGRVLETASQGPLANVSVTVVGSTMGTYTRPDGGYVLSAVPAGSVKLRVARIGYVAKEVAVNVVGGQTYQVDITLDAVAAQLAAVVTTGYGTREARDRTGVVETVTEKTFNTGRIMSPEQLIQAKVAGVQVVDNNEPGGGISMRIRGGSSITSSNEPLFVVDGVPLQVGGGVSAGRNPLNFLNPRDIESISVLKDASATAIYGSRGSNGVVLITTKAGQQGTQVEYSSMYSSSQVIKDPELLNASQYTAAIAQYAPENVGKVGSSSTNWRDQIQRSAGGQEHNFAVSGGKDASRYRLSLSVLDQDGIVQGTTVQRLGGAINYSDRLFDDRFEVKTSLKASRNNDKFTPGSVLGSATYFAPTQPVYKTDGTYFQWSEPLGANNPVKDLADIQDNGTTFRSIANLETKYRFGFLEGLTGTVRGGYDFTQSSRVTFSPSSAQQDIESSRGGRFDKNNPRQNNSIFELFGNYAKRVDDWSSDVDLTAGYTYEYSNGDYPSFYAEKLTSDLLGPNGIPGAGVQQNFYNIQEAKLASFFARLNFTAKDKYLLTVSARRDGSSRFGPGNQWGTFPSFALAWRLIGEDFLKDNGVFSDLKLRYSWGVNGNQAFPNYLFLSTYSNANAQGQVQFGNQYVTPIRPTAVDPNIKWEETTSNNIGLDYGFWGNRVTGTIDVYTKKTEDLIFNVPVAAGTNLSNFVTTNIGNMENKGLELGLNARLIDKGTGGFRWDFNLAASTNSNKLLSINENAGGASRILTGNISGGVGTQIQVLEPGQPVNSFFVYRTKTDASGNPVMGDKTDIEMYVDQNGDGNINQDDRVAYKNPAPRWIFGHTSTMSYKGFDAAFTLRAYMGAYVYNNIASNMGNYQTLKGNAPGNLSASVLETGYTRPQYFSDVYVEDASFLRLDNLTLGYRFGKTRAWQAIRIFGGVQNAFTTSGYSGVDPLAGVNGIDNNIYPLARTFTTGINIFF